MLCPNKCFQRLANLLSLFQGRLQVAWCIAGSGQLGLRPVRVGVPNVGTDDGSEPLWLLRGLLHLQTLPEEFSALVDGTQPRHHELWSVRVSRKMNTANGLAGNPQLWMAADHVSRDGLALLGVRKFEAAHAIQCKGR